MDFFAQQKTWFIAHTNNATIHCGVVLTDECVSTGQESLETFTNEQEWLARKLELGVIEEQPITE